MVIAACNSPQMGGDPIATNDSSCALQCNVLGHNAATDSAPPSKYGSMLFACDRQKVEERCLSVSVKSESLFGEIYHTLKVDGENERYRGEVGGKLGGGRCRVSRETQLCLSGGVFYEGALPRKGENLKKWEEIVIQWCCSRLLHIHREM